MRYHSFVTFRTGDSIRRPRSSLIILVISRTVVLCAVFLSSLSCSVTREHTRWTKHQTNLPPSSTSATLAWYDGRGNSLVMLSSSEYHSDVIFTTTTTVLPTARPVSVVTEVGSVSQVPEFGLVTRAHTSWTSHK